jgi:hypothetical protein
MGARADRRTDCTNSPRWWGARFCAARFALVVILLLCPWVVPQGWAPETGEFDWLRQFGTSSNDFAFAVDSDEDDHVYVVGTTTSAFPGHVNAGLGDAFLRKYDRGGNELWTRQFGTDGWDQIYAVLAHNTDLYVGGGVGDGTGAALPGHVNAGLGDAFLRKYDANGNEAWTRQFGTPGLDNTVGIFADATGVYICGGVRGALPGQTYAGLVDAFVRKYDHVGNELWTRQFGTGAVDAASKITGDESGVYVVGRTAGALPGQTHGGLVDAFVRKYDEWGTELWTHQFGTLGVDLADDAAIDGTGHVYVTGRTDGALPGQIRDGGADAFVRKYDTSGAEIWTRQFGTSMFDVARGLSVRGSVVYVSGVTGGASAAFPGAVGADVFVRAYSTKGTHLWTEVFGSEVAEDNWGVVAGSAGLYVIGSTAGAFAGLDSQGGIDAFIARMLTEVVVEIDIIPRVIGPGRGVVTVAILSTLTFDATTVDPASVVLADAGVWLRGQGRPRALVADVNGDRLPDLVLQFDIEALALPSTETIAELTGRTFAGRVIYGFHVVETVPR